MMRGFEARERGGGGGRRGADDGGVVWVGAQMASKVGDVGVKFASPGTSLRSCPGLI